jgi:hypothetical protein
MSVDSTAQTGDVCQGTFAITGLGSYLIGIDNLLNIDWQTGAIEQLRQTLTAQNCTLTYASIDLNNNTILAQYTPNAAPVSSDIPPGHAQSMILPEVVYVIAMNIIANLIVAGLIAWFVLDVIPDAVGKLVGIASSSPVASVVVYGGMALVGLVLIAYIMKKWRDR